MRWLRSLVFVSALIICCTLLVQSGRAQAAGGIAATTSDVRYTPTAFPQLVQLSDFSSVTVALSAVDASGNALTYVLVSGPSLGSLGALDPIAGTVTYTPPTGFSSIDTFVFSVSDGVLSSNTATVTIFAPQPSVSLSTNTLDLGSQAKGASSPTKTITVSNSSVASLNIGGISIGGTSPSDFVIVSSGTCPIAGSLAAHGTCTVAVSFIPTATGPQSATIILRDNALDSPQTVLMTGTGTDFSFAPAPNSSFAQTVTAGRTATYNLQINGTNGFSGQVNVNCSGAPPLSTCTVNPAVVNVNGASAPFTVTVTTTAPVTSAKVWQWGPRGNSKPYWYGVLALGLLMVPGFLRIRVRTHRLMRTACAAALLLLMASCGGSGASPSLKPGQPGTPSGTYTLAINGTVNGATRNSPLTLTVQ